MNEIGFLVLLFGGVIISRCISGKRLAQILIGLATIGAVVMFFAYYTIQIVPR